MGTHKSTYDRLSDAEARVNREWARKVTEEQFVRETEHRCGNCMTPGYGKSSIRCKNEPGGKRD